MAEDFRFSNVLCDIEDSILANRPDEVSEPVFRRAGIQRSQAPRRWIIEAAGGAVRTLTGVRNFVIFQVVRCSERAVFFEQITLVVVGTKLEAFQKRIVEMRLIRLVWLRELLFERLQGKQTVDEIKNE